MAVVAPQQLTKAGLTPTFGAASAAGDEFVFGGSNLVVFRNSTGSPITVTVVSPGQVEGLNIDDATLTVPANGDRYVSGFTGKVFQNAERRVGVTYSTHVGLTLAVLAL